MKGETGRGFDTLTALLPYAAELAKDDGFIAYMDNLHDLAALAPLLRRHRAAALGIAAAASGKTVREIRAQPFMMTLAAFSKELMGELLLLVRLLAACGPKPVARALYTYRPDTVQALCTLIEADMEQRTIDLYACDLLRFIAGVFADKASRLPSVRELLYPKEKLEDNRSGMEIFDSIVSAALGGGTAHERPCEGCTDGKS